MNRFFQSFRLLSSAVVLCIVPATLHSQSYDLRSPDGATEVTVGTTGTLTVSIAHRGEPLLHLTGIAINLPDGRSFGGGSPVLTTRADSVDGTIIPVVPEKRSVIPDVYRQLQLTFSGGFSLLVRAYDDGVAYRFRTDLPHEITVASESLTVQLAPGDSVWIPTASNYLSHSEHLFRCAAVESIPDTQLCCLPVVVAHRSGMKIAISEADLRDYPGLYLKGSGLGIPALHGTLPAYPEAEELVGDRTVKVTRRAPYIARTTGSRDFPWRVFGIAKEDKDLIENDIVYRLGSPCVLKETAWIRPGKVAWDWWNANNIEGVPFKSGINTDTYRYFLDFAAAHGIEYIILDEGWTKPSDLFQINPDMDLDALFAHAAKKNVGIILWVTWNALEAQMSEALDRFAQWGAKGIKVDFMQRDDQKMVNYYERVAREAASRHMLVDFHGSYKPTGLSRTYPNVLTREGVKGLENSKWSADITPAHDVTIPYTRMFAGPMDYTPGAMSNAARGSFRPIYEQPMSQGTRSHQLAMYVVYESPLQMLCDAPSSYLKEKATMEFLTAVPTTWDETKVLNGAIGQYVSVARRKGTTWYIGSMTDWTPREFTFDLSFMGKTPRTMVLYEDGINAHRRGSDYVKRTQRIDPRTPLTIRLAAGGGWVARISVR